MQPVLKPIAHQVHFVVLDWGHLDRFAHAQVDEGQAVLSAQNIPSRLVDHSIGSYSNMAGSKESKLDILTRPCTSRLRWAVH
jgi:hypothetical protein